jgi:hypothetical protein
MRRRRLRVRYKMRRIRRHGGNSLRRRMRETWRTKKMRERRECEERDGNEREGN